MRTLARTVYLDSQLGVDSELPRAGSALEHPLVYDDAAREIKRLADEGLVEIVDERRRDSLIDWLCFRRIR